MTERRLPLTADTVRSFHAVPAAGSQVPAALLSVEPASALPRRACLRLLPPLGLAVWLAACSQMPFSPAPIAEPKPAVPKPELTAFRAQLNGASMVPPLSSLGQGELLAVLNRKTGLLRWKLSYQQLSGPVLGASFHSPAMEDEVAAPVLSLGQNLRSPHEGSATLTPRQSADLLAGQWYVSLRTKAFPDGELRGQLIEQR